VLRPLLPEQKVKRKSVSPARKASSSGHDISTWSRKNGSESAVVVLPSSSSDGKAAFDELK
jgi:hypothetical protein